MKCAERRAATRNFDFGSEFVLNSAGTATTVLDAIPMGKANAVTVSLVVISVPTGATVRIVFLVSNDDANYTSIGSAAVSAAGVYWLQATQLTHAFLRFGLRAQGTQGNSISAVSAQIGNS